MLRAAATEMSNHFDASASDPFSRMATSSAHLSARAQHLETRPVLFGGRLWYLQGPEVLRRIEEAVLHPSKAGELFLDELALFIEVAARNELILIGRYTRLRPVERLLRLRAQPYRSGNGSSACPLEPDSQLDDLPLCDLELMVHHKRIG